MFLSVNSLVGDFFSFFKCCADRVMEWRLFLGRPWLIDKRDILCSSENWHHSDAHINFFNRLFGYFKICQSWPFPQTFLKLFFLCPRGGFGMSNNFLGSERSSFPFSPLPPSLFFFPFFLFHQGNCEVNFCLSPLPLLPQPRGEIAPASKKAIFLFLFFFSRRRAGETGGRSSKGNCPITANVSFPVGFSFSFSKINKNDISSLRVSRRGRTSRRSGNGILLFFPFRNTGKKKRSPAENEKKFKIQILISHSRILRETTVLAAENRISGHLHDEKIGGENVSQFERSEFPTFSKSENKRKVENRFKSHASITPPPFPSLLLSPLTKYGTLTLDSRM